MPHESSSEQSGRHHKEQPVHGLFLQGCNPAKSRKLARRSIYMLPTRDKTRSISKHRYRPRDVTLSVIYKKDYRVLYYTLCRARIRLDFISVSVLVATKFLSSAMKVRKSIRTDCNSPETTIPQNNKPLNTLNSRIDQVPNAALTTQYVHHRS
jgi:hypothetical protein